LGKNTKLIEKISGFLNESIDSIVVDFDQTFIRESLLIQWVLFIVFNSTIAPQKRLMFLFKSICRGFLSISLSHSPRYCEQAVRSAFGALSGFPVSNIDDFILHRWKRKGRYAINLNTDLLQVLQNTISILRNNNLPRPRLIISSQGSFLLAIRTFLRREDVVAQLARISICPFFGADTGSTFITNQLETREGKFTGRLIPPVVTKYNRLQLFPGNTLFIGDGKDEAILKRLDGSGVRFLNYTKI
jgi:hypothetical protein